MTTAERDREYLRESEHLHCHSHLLCSNSPTFQRERPPLPREREKQTPTIQREGESERSRGRGREAETGLRVHDLWFMVYGLWFWVSGLWFRVQLSPPPAIIARHRERERGMKEEGSPSTVRSCHLTLALPERGRDGEGRVPAIQQRVTQNSMEPTICREGGYSSKLR